MGRTKKIDGMPWTVASGVYRITYLPTGQSYIGSSMNIYGRWTTHIGSDSSSFMNYYGLKDIFWKFPERFNWTVSKIVHGNREKLELWESFYMIRYQTLMSGFNRILPILFQTFKQHYERGFFGEEKFENEDLYFYRLCDVLSATNPRLTYFQDETIPELTTEQLKKKIDDRWIDWDDYL